MFFRHSPLTMQTMHALIKDAGDKKTKVRSRHAQGLWSLPALAALLRALLLDRLPSHQACFCFAVLLFDAFFIIASCSVFMHPLRSHIFSFTHISFRSLTLFFRSLTLFFRSLLLFSLAQNGLTILRGKPSFVKYILRTAVLACESVCACAILFSCVLVHVCMAQNNAFLNLFTSWMSKVSKSPTCSSSAWIWATLC